MLTKLKDWIFANKVPLLAFLITRIGLWLLAYLSLILIPARSGDGLWRAFPNNLWLDGWSRWDSGWYVNIAEHGYSNVLQNVYLNTAFFPLYPLLIKGLSFLTGNFHIAGMLIANLSLLLAMIFLYKLLKEQFEEEIAGRTVLLLLLSPFSFFFSAVYSESLFILLVVLVFYFGNRQKWALAVLFSALAGATRAVGFLTVLPILYLYLKSINFQWRKIRLPLLWLPLSALGPGSYMAYLAIKFGDPFLFVKSQNAPGWKEGVSLLSALDALRIPFTGSALLTGEYPAIYVLHVLSFLLGLGVLILMVRRMNPEYSIWAIATLLVSFTVWISVGRFMIVIFPLFLALALLFRGKKYDALLYLSVILLSLLTVLFTHWYWVG